MNFFLKNERVVFACEMEKLAIAGGRPTSDHWIPISKLIIGNEEIESVVKVLRSGQLREGRMVKRFEEEFRENVALSTP